MIGKTNANGFTGSATESAINYEKLPISYLGNITNMVKHGNIVLVCPSKTKVIFVSKDNGNKFQEVYFTEFIVDVIYSKSHNFFLALDATGNLYTSTDGTTFSIQTWTKPSLTNLSTYLSLIESGEGFVIAALANNYLVGKTITYSEGTFNVGSGSCSNSVGSPNNISASSIIKSNDVMIIDAGRSTSSSDGYAYAIDKNCQLYSVDAVPYYNGTNFIREIEHKTNYTNYIFYEQSKDCNSFLTTASYLKAGHEKRKIFEYNGLIYGFSVNGIKSGKTVSRMFESELEYDFPTFEMSYGAVFEDGSAYVAGSGSVYKMFFDQKYVIPTLNYTLEAAKECYKKTIEAKESVDESIEEIKSIQETIEEIQEVADDLIEIKNQTIASASSASTSASTATSKASEATTAATNAEASKTAAQTAKTDALAAKEAAESAKADAETAKTAAESAQEAAETAEANAKTYKEQAEQFLANNTDAELSDTSENPVQNKVVNAALQGVKEHLTTVDVHNATKNSFNLDTAEGGILIDNVKGNTHKSANLLPSNALKTITINSISFTANGNELVVNGTDISTRSSYGNQFSLPIGTYTFTVYCSRSIKINMSVRGYKNGSYSMLGTAIYDTNTSITFTNDGSYEYLVLAEGCFANIEYSNDVMKLMINEGSTAQPYEPYGLFVSGQMGIVDISEMDWNYGSSSRYFYAQSPSGCSNVRGIDFYSNEFSNAGVVGISDQKDKTLQINSNGNWWIKDYSCTTVSDFVNKYKGKYVAYPLADGGEPSKYSLAIQTNNGKSTTSTDYKAKEVFIPLSSPLCEGDSLTYEKETHVKGYVNLEDLNYEWSDSMGMFVCKNPPTDSPSVSNPAPIVICDTYDCATSYNSMTDKSILLNSSSVSSEKRICIKDSSIGTDATKIKGKMVYPLVTPSVTETTNEQKKALVSLESYDGKTIIDSADNYAKAEFALSYGMSETVAKALNGERLSKLEKLERIEAEYGEDVTDHFELNTSYFTKKWLNATKRGNIVFFKGEITCNTAPTNGTVVFTHDMGTINTDQRIFMYGANSSYTSICMQISNTQIKISSFNVPVANTYYFIEGFFFIK